jgi:hypothetical protein
MNIIKYIVIAIMSTAMFGCPAARPKQLAQPETITSRGTYTHPASGMTFPIKIRISSAAPYTAMIQVTQK